MSISTNPLAPPRAQDARIIQAVGKPDCVMKPGRACPDWRKDEAAYVLQVKSVNVRAVGRQAPAIARSWIRSGLFLSRKMDKDKLTMAIR